MYFHEPPTWPSRPPSLPPSLPVGLSGHSFRHVNAVVAEGTPPKMPTRRDTTTCSAIIRAGKSSPLRRIPREATSEQAGKIEVRVMRHARPDQMQPPSYRGTCRWGGDEATKCDTESLMLCLLRSDLPCQANLRMLCYAMLGSAALSC